MTYKKDLQRPSRKKQKSYARRPKSPPNRLARIKVRFIRRIVEIHALTRPPGRLMDLVPVATAFVIRQIPVFRSAEPRAGEAGMVHVRRRGDAPADEEPDLAACFHRRRLGLRPCFRGVSAAD